MVGLRTKASRKKPLIEVMNESGGVRRRRLPEKILAVILCRLHYLIFFAK